MLKTGKGYEYAKKPDSTNIVKAYRISANDVISFNLYSNDGFKLIDLSSLNESNAGYRVQGQLDFLVEYDGTVKLPVLGRTKISGYTIREAEFMLEEKYSASYVSPFVVLDVTNRRVIVFPGSEGDAKTIPLKNNNTTLLEAIALAGGIADQGKAKQVKLIRDLNGKREVYLIDLSTINGLEDANMVLLANDIIYIEARRRYVSKILQEVTPIISLITTTFIVFTYFNSVSKKLQ